MAPRAACRGSTALLGALLLVLIACFAPALPRMPRWGVQHPMESRATTLLKDSAYTTASPRLLRCLSDHRFIVLGDSTSRALWGQMVQLVDGKAQTEWNHERVSLNRSVPCERPAGDVERCMLSVAALYWPPLSASGEREPRSARLFDRAHDPLDQLNTLWTSAARRCTSHSSSPGKCAKTTLLIGASEANWVDATARWFEWKLLSNSERRTGARVDASARARLRAAESAPLRGSVVLVYRSNSPIRDAPLAPQRAAARRMKGAVDAARRRIALAVERRSRGEDGGEGMGAPPAALRIRVLWLDLYTPLERVLSSFRDRVHWHNPFGRIGIGVARDGAADGGAPADGGVYGAVNYDLTVRWIAALCAAHESEGVYSSQQ